MKNKKIIVSGIGPGQGGVGNYLEYLTNKFDKHLFYFPKRINTKVQIFNKLFFGFNAIINNYKLRLIKNKNVIVIAYNYISYKSLNKLIKNNNVTIYLMDNSFFCLKAYNFINKECFKCLNGNWQNSSKNNCVSQPKIISRDSYNRINDLILKNQDKINFLTLSYTNKNLLSEHINSNKQIGVCYFITSHLKNDFNNYEKGLFKNNEEGYDFVFHSSDIDAKGFSYVIRLAELLKDFSFFIPTKKDIGLKNVITSDIRWESGLKEIVINAKIVLTPSLWSYTPEAAMLKSIIVNGCVAINKSKFGFNNEMPSNSVILLSGNLIDDVIILSNYIEKKEKRVELRKSSRLFLKKYLKMASEQISIVFGE